MVASATRGLQGGKEERRGQDFHGSLVDWLNCNQYCSIQGAGRPRILRVGNAWIGICDVKKSSLLGFLVTHES